MNKFYADDPRNRLLLTFLSQDVIDLYGYLPGRFYFITSAHIVGSTRADFIRTGSISMEDRRAVDRVKVSFKVTWQGSLGILNGEITDLSTRGCFILADDKVTLGEAVRLEIQQPESGHLSLLAEVIYRMPEIGFGVRFTGGDESERRRLRWLVKAESLRMGNKM